MDFKNFHGGIFFKICSSINLPWGHARSHKKIGPDRFSRFDVYWIQTDRQTDKLNLYIEGVSKQQPRCLHMLTVVYIPPDNCSTVQLSCKQNYGFPKIMGRSLETISSKFVMFVDNVESIPLKYKAN